MVTFLFFLLLFKKAESLLGQQAVELWCSVQIKFPQITLSVFVFIFVGNNLNE